MQKRGQDRERTTDRGKERQGKGERRGEIERREEISDNIEQDMVKQRVSEGEEKLRRRSISSGVGDENRRKEVADEK